MSETLGQALRRFNTVMAARKTTTDLLELIGKLAVSDKFAESHKTACYGKLIEACLQRIASDREKSLSYARLVYEAGRNVPDGAVQLLFDAVRGSPAIPAIRLAYSTERVEQIIGSLVRRVIALTPKTTADLTQAFRRLTGEGISCNRLEIICMLIASGMPHDEIDSICDLTWSMELAFAPKAEADPELI